MKQTCLVNAKEDEKGIAGQARNDRPFRMKSISIFKTGFMILSLMVMWQCSEVKEWNDPTDAIPPGQVSEVKVENLNGGAMITYRLPNDADLLGVKAVYATHEEGEIYESFSSAFRDTIILEGYKDTNEHVVQLFTIDLSRNLSEPVQAIIKPLISPVDLIRETLSANATYGGFYLKWDNPMRKEIAVSLYVDSIGEKELVDTHFSNAVEGRFALRGFESKKQNIRIEVRDRWMNYSIPLDTVLTPLFEEEIVGRNSLNQEIWTLWGLTNRECQSRGDTWASSGGNMFGLWTDGNYSNWGQIGDDWCMFKHFVPGWPDNEFAVPAYFTIDMGRPATYSRIKMWGRNASSGVFSYIMTVFEVWGTNDPKPLIPEVTSEDRLTNLRYWTGWPEINATDAWKEDWIRLGSYTVITPSGTGPVKDGDTFTSEDAEFYRNGMDFEISPDANTTPCRYIRFLVTQSFWPARRQGAQYAEVKFFGAYVD
jgi:hypothetical protein